jgi:predicted nucleotidyltransferase
MINLYEKNLPLIQTIIKEESVDCLILFGSYVQNTQKSTSDLDLCVLFKPNTTLNNKKEVLSMYNSDIDLSDFDELPTLLQYKVFLKGKFLKNEAKREKLITQLKIQVLDFLPLQNRILKTKGLPEINFEQEVA